VSGRDLGNPRIGYSSSARCWTK